MELKITDDRVREAVKDCPDAARVLEKLFPAAFKKEGRLLPPSTSTIAVTFEDGAELLIEPRENGEYAWRGFYLNYWEATGDEVTGTWQVVTDSQGASVLLPPGTKKRS